ncbi:MAG: hypothetical protein A3A08_00025 [Candidatus Nealsonbacteria bacterium RIFCSPLOWO2_01_FULL_41_9]|uniref:Cohesin domain-containing protein n=1 Tax=Candidatus Nealsonbacteria bacterium RIFCSPLOWO2_01_FULL_41_9 TaxID=1801671 RepID=A0A1G2EB09_9BACT|nr:MAG: hypothetical protein A3A08_00025 [Candidatus Nealsonbacteria bacterium RIFCSPLOWO2_01_FULL_41_9]
MQNYNSKFKIIISAAIFILFPVAVRAAVLYLDPAEGNYYQGDVFVAALRIDTKGECVNTLKVDLSFQKDLLEVIDFSQGNSILAIWLQSPKIYQEQGTVSFIGGIPAGFCGVLAGDPGKSNLLGKIIFKVKEARGGQTSAKVEFSDSSEVLLNDGLGTKAQLTLKNAIFTIFSGIPEVPQNQWQEELKKDNILPEIFEVEINKDPLIFDGKYFITFSSQDKQSGINQYEVKEGNKDWKKATSPYLLENQWLRSIIRVKAIDKAGNERIVEKAPLNEPIPWLAIISIVILLGIGYFLYKKRWRAMK